MATQVKGFGWALLTCCKCVRVWVTIVIMRGNNNKSSINTAPQLVLAVVGNMWWGWVPFEGVSIIIDISVGVVQRGV